MERFAVYGERFQSPEDLEGRPSQGCKVLFCSKILILIKFHPISRNIFLNGEENMRLGIFFGVVFGANK